LAPLLTPDNRTNPDMSEAVRPPENGPRPDGQDNPPIGVSGLSAPIRPQWSVLPDREGETTILMACLALGIPFRPMRRAFVWGAPPETPRLGRIDEYGVWWAPAEEVRAVFTKAPAPPIEMVSARQERMTARMERLRRMGLEP
jgi:hypothetical protein